MSLRFRIAGTIFVLGTLLVGVVLWITLGHSLGAVRAQVRAAEDVTIRLIGELSRAALLTQDYAELQSFVSNAQRDPRIKAVLLADAGGTIVVGTDAGLVGARQGALPEMRQRYWRVTPVSGYTNWLGTLSVQFSDAPLIAAWRATGRLGVAIAVAGMACLTLAGLALGHYLTRQLRSLAAAADAVTAGEAAPPIRAPPEGGDEVARVGRAFAAMVDRLQAHVKALARARDRLMVPTEAMSQGFALWDADDRLLLFNSRLRELLPGVEDRISQGVELAALARALEERSLADASAGELALTWIAARAEEVALFEMRLRDGRRIEVRESRTPDGGAVGIYTDVTREKAREQALALNEQRLRHIMASVFDGVVTVDRAGAIESVNAAGERIFGWRAEGLVGEPIGRLLAHAAPGASRGGEARPLGVADLRALPPNTLHELGGRRRDGSTFPVEVSAAAMDGDGEGAAVVCAVRDISQRKETEARIIYTATHDHLTGLPNRNLLHDRLDTALRHARRRREKVAVMFLDLDHFKVVNDSLGHPAGDAVLVAVADRLRAAVRGADTVARMGGDEFIVLLRDVRGAEDAVAVGEKLVRAVSEPVQAMGHELHPGLSVGISLFPEHGDGADALLKHADTALYEAKGAGRNRVRLFAPQMSDTSYQRMLLENRLRRALERDEFFLVYQPQFSLESGGLQGFEALVRWRNPDLGLVTPGRFVPVAEESGLITDLGLWVVRTALAESRRWSRLLPTPVRLGLNVSPRQLHDPGLARQIRALLDEIGADPATIELELTERVLMAESETVQQLIAELDAMGVALVLDDFGTGYSSLSYLKRYPISRIKVDRSFVADMERSENDAKLVRAMIGMAHGLGIGVTAEGIETPGQASTLLGYGCDEGQGFLLGHPVAAGEALAIVERGRPALVLPQGPRLVAAGAG